MSDLAAPRARRPGWFYRWMMGFLGLFDRWLRLSCRLFIRLASEKHERPLGSGERMRQAMHRMMCSLCRIQEKRVDQLRMLAQEVGRNSVAEGQAELSPEAVERIRKAMAEIAAHAGPRGSSKS